MSLDNDDYVVLEDSDYLVPNSERSEADCSSLVSGATPSQDHEETPATTCSPDDVVHDYLVLGAKSPEVTESCPNGCTALVSPANRAESVRRYSGQWQKYAEYQSIPASTRLATVEDTATGVNLFPANKTESVTKRPKGVMTSQVNDLVNDMASASLDQNHNAIRSASAESVTALPKNGLPRGRRPERVECLREKIKSPTADYELDRDELQIVRKVGKGHFGDVYLGLASWLPGNGDRDVQVAVKSTKNLASESENKDFLYELEIMKLVNSLNHPNIIKLLACCTSAQPYLIVLEFMSHGNLQKFLRDTKSGDIYHLRGQSESLTERHLLKFALDIARGMEAISDMQLLHRDLAARNILVSEDLTCKVADFGLAKNVTRRRVYKCASVLLRKPRPIRWLPPESLVMHIHSIRSDVWSYGILLWEIVTLANLPYPSMESRDVMKEIARGYRMPRPPHCSPDIYRVMAECWEERSDRRPSFKQIAEKMEQLLQQSAEFGVINMSQLRRCDDYIDVLPPGEQEIVLEMTDSESFC